MESNIEKFKSYIDFELDKRFGVVGKRLADIAKSNEELKHFRDEQVAKNNEVASKFANAEKSAGVTKNEVEAKLHELQEKNKKDAARLDKAFTEISENSNMLHSQKNSLQQIEQHISGIKKDFSTLVDRMLKTENKLLNQEEFNQEIETIKKKLDYFTLVVQDRFRETKDTAASQNNLIDEQAKQLSYLDSRILGCKTSLVELNKEFIDRIDSGRQSISDSVSEIRSYFENKFAALHIPSIDHLVVNKKFEELVMKLDKFVIDVENANIRSINCELDLTQVKKLMENMQLQLKNITLRN